MFNSHSGLWKSTALKRLLAESLFIFLLDCLRFPFFKGKQDVSTVDWLHWKSFMIQKPDNATHWMCAQVGVRGAIASPTRHASSFFWLTLLGQQQICEGHMQRKGQQPRMASSEVIHATPRPRPNTNLNMQNTKNSPSQIPNTFSQGHEEDREGYKQGWNRVRLFVQHSCNTTFSFADSLQQGGVRNVGQNLTECYTVTVSATLNGAFAFVASSSCSTVAFFFFVFSYSTSSFSPLTSSALKVRHRLQHWRECRHQSDWIVDCG